MTEMSQEQIQAVVREAVKDTIVEMLDVDNVREFRADLRWVRTQRVGSEELGKHIRRGIYGAMGSAVIYLMYLGYQAWVAKGGP